LIDYDAGGGGGVCVCVCVSDQLYSLTEDLIGMSILPDQSLEPAAVIS